MNVITGIAGIQSLSIEHRLDETTRINLELVAFPGYDANHLWNENWKDLFPGNVIVKCGHCGQWGARQTACKHCGAAID